MLVEWSRQLARRFRVCAVLPMHEPHLGIHTLWRFPSASIQSFLFSTGQKGNAGSCQLPRSVDIGLFIKLRLRFALCSCSPFYSLSPAENKGRSA